MNSVSTGIMTKEEFYSKFRFALSYYDHYLLYASFIRTKEYFAQRALKAAGLVSATHATILVRALMKAWNEPLDAGGETDTMRFAWQHYSTVGYKV